MKVRPKSKSTW